MGIFQEIIESKSAEVWTDDTEMWKLLGYEAVSGPSSESFIGTTLF
jgi:hypothetical protein